MKKSNLTKLFFYTLLGLNALIATNLIYSANEQVSPSSSKRRSGREEIAYRGDDDSLYDRNRHRYDWNYRDNWRYNTDNYLSYPQGQNQQYNQQNVRSNRNSYPSQAYQNNRNPVQIGPVYYPEQWKNWDYRTNWSDNATSRDAFLRGEMQDDYYEQVYGNGHYRRR